MAACNDAGGGTGSARRRRERRLRAYLRYARMSVAMALAECQHHSAQRPKKARAREEEREVHYTAAFRTTVPPPEPELLRPLRGAWRGAARLSVGAAGAAVGGSHGTFVAHLADLALMVQILDAPVPQKGSRARGHVEVCGLAGAHRAGYRRARDLPGQYPAAFGSSSSADGRTVGGSTDDRGLLFSTAADW